MKICYFKKLSDKAVEPKRGSENAAGYDLYSIEDYILKSGERKLFKIDISLDQENGGYAQIEGRSGLAYKYGVLVLGGIIDSDYSGNIGVILLNTGDKELVINQGDRIAQLIFHNHYSPELVEVKEIKETIRGESGFGSTGTK